MSTIHFYQFFSIDWHQFVIIQWGKKFLYFILLKSKTIDQWMRMKKTDWLRIDQLGEIIENVIEYVKPWVITNKKRLGKVGIKSFYLIKHKQVDCRFDRRQ